MPVEHWIGLGIFGLGVALNAGVVWKGLSIVEHSVEELQEKVEELSTTLGKVDSELSSIRREVRRMEHKVYGPQ